MKTKYRFPGYWKQYNTASKNMCPSRVFNLAGKYTARLPAPRKKSRRGRPFKHDPRGYAALQATRSFFSWSTRETEAFSELLLGGRVDHATVSWWQMQTSLLYFRRLLWLLYASLTSGLTQLFYLGDSTGLRTDRTRFVERFTKQSGFEIEDLKMHLLAAWLPRRHAIAVASVACTPGEAHDSPVFRRLLQSTPLMKGKAVFYDSAADAEANFELAFELGLRPFFKFRKNTRRGFFRRKARKLWNKNSYNKYRSRIETVFAGNEMRCANTVRERLQGTRQCAVTLLGITHNLRTAIRLGIQALLRLIRQPPGHRNL